MNEPRPLDAAKVERLKERFERFREREATAEPVRLEPIREGRRGERATERSTSRGKDRELGD
jgi:hypothetical protein